MLHCAVMATCMLHRQVCMLKYLCSMAQSAEENVRMRHLVIATCHAMLVLHKGCDFAPVVACSVALILICGSMNEANAKAREEERRRSGYISLTLTLIGWRRSGYISLTLTLIGWHRSGYISLGSSSCILHYILYYILYCYEVI